MKMRRLFWAGAILALPACTPATGNYFAPTAAVVCGEDVECVKIPEARIGDFLTQVVQNPSTAGQFHGPQGPANRLEAKRLVLNELIRQSVARQHAAKEGIEVTQAEINRRFKQIRDRFPNEQAFLSSLRSQNFSPADLRIYLGNQMLYEEIAAHLTKGRDPSEAQLRDFYEQNRIGSYDTQIRVAHILVCNGQDPRTGLCETTPNDEALAKEIADRARSGGDFAALATQFSKDPSTAKNGGDLGYVTQGQLAVEFENAAFGLEQPGQISDPVKTPFGVHVIKLIAKGKSFEEARPEILREFRGQIQKQAFDSWIQDHVAAARVRVNPKFGRFDRVSQTVVPLKVQLPPTPRANPNAREDGSAGAPQAPAAPPAPQEPPAPGGAPAAPAAP